MQETDSHPLPQAVSFSVRHALINIARRALDIFASVLGLLILSPFFAVLAYSIKQDSPGPVFYRGPRMGKNGRPFGILKFRTMFECAESYAGPRITADGDERITPLGKWLRDTKINELPQLWNVLVGEMSLVGPRPEDPEIAKAWPEDLRKQLLSVRPGITSPATVVFRGEEKMLQSANVLNDYLRAILPDKLRIDSLYLRDRTLITDLDVLFMTMALLLPRIRSMQVPETLLYWGPIAQFVSRYLNWFVLDTLVAFGAIGMSGVIWRMDTTLDLGMELALMTAVGVSLCFSLTNALLRLNQVHWRRAPFDAIFPLGVSTCLATIALMIFNRLFGRLPVGMLVLAGVLAFGGFAGFRFRGRLLSGMANYWLRMRGQAQRVGERVLIVGAGVNAQFATWLLCHSDLSRAFSIVGMVDDDPRKQNMYFDGYPVLGSSRDLPELIRRDNIGLVLFTISNIAEGDRQRILRLCQGTAARVVIFPEVIEELSAHFIVITQDNMAGATHPGD